MQRTLKNPIQCTGTGLHSGVKVMMTLRPAAANSGIVFMRTDIAGGANGDNARIPARWDHVVDTRMCTVLAHTPGRDEQRDHGPTIGTVEHLMAALSGCGVDNAVIEINGPEVPAMDGSAGPFVFLLECAGLVEQAASRKAIKVLKPVDVTHKGSTALLFPTETPSISFEIDFDTPLIARQACDFRLVNGTFKSEISRARTFGFLQDVAQLREAGLALGGSLDNAVVIAGDKILNEDGLRYQDEFVRHKVLDTIGDLYLAGMPILGGFHGVRSGHQLNNRLLAALFADPEAYTLVDAPRYDGTAGAPGPDQSHHQGPDQALGTPGRRHATA